MQNVLYYGDNLQILRDYIKDESVDLIYLDPRLAAQINAIRKRHTKYRWCAQVI